MVGQSVALDTVATLVVSAVIADIPANSRFSDVEYFCPWLFAEKTLRTVHYGSWTGYNHQAYVLLRPGVALDTFNKKIRTFVDTHDTDPSNTAHIFLHPAAKWHLYNKSENGQMVAGVLALILLLIASPIAWWAMNQWLEDFAYRIEVEWWIFVLTGLAAVATALLTVSWQAIRAAVANPVDSLRDE